MDLHWYMIS